MKHFNSPAAFARHLERLALIGPEVVHVAADKCGELVAKTAKAEIGYSGMYGMDLGPFASGEDGSKGWAHLADSTEAEKARSGYPIDAPLLRTGELRDSISHVTQYNKTTIGSNSPLMVYHEFGTKNMPPRSVLGSAMFISKNKITVGLGRVVASWVGGLSWKREKITDK